MEAGLQRQCAGWSGPRSAGVSTLLPIAAPVWGTGAVRAPLLLKLLQPRGGSVGGRFSPSTPCREVVGGSLGPPTTSRHAASRPWMPKMQRAFDFSFPYRKGRQNEHCPFLEMATDSLSVPCPRSSYTQEVEPATFSLGSDLSHMLHGGARAWLSCTGCC